MDSSINLNRHKMLINQNELKREKIKVAFEYCVEKISCSMEALKDKHIHVDQSETEEDLVKILESNINEFKMLLDRAVDFEKNILESFKQEKG